MTHADVLRSALEAGRDPHTAWAAVCLGKEESAVTKEERNKAKRENYMILYASDFMASVKFPSLLFPKDTK